MQNLTKHLDGGMTQQRGVVLIMALVIVLLISIVALASVKGSGLQEAMASNMRDRSVSLQATESALAEAENYLVPDPNSAPPDCGGSGKCVGYKDAQNSGLYLLDNDFIAKSQVLTQTLNGVNSSPRYYIEAMQCFIPDDGSGVDQPPGCGALAITPYLITGKGVGVSALSPTILQSIFNRRSK